MLKYFKELENKENQYLELIEWNTKRYYVISENNLPFSFYQKYASMFEQIRNLDLLCQKSIDSDKKVLFWDNEMDNRQEIFLSDLIAKFLNGFDTSGYNLTEAGKERLDILVSLFKKEYPTYDFDDLDEYVSAVFELFVAESYLFFYNDPDEKSIIKRFLSAVLIVARYQKKLTESLENQINQALEEMAKLVIKVPLKKFNSVNFSLPNCWFITPDNRIYNSLGPGAHKECNLIYPYRHAINDQVLPKSSDIEKHISAIEESGFITYEEFEKYLNLIYDFPIVYPPEYYTLNNIQKMWYNHVEKRCYNPKIRNIIIGILSAQANFYKFFEELKTYSTDYQRDLEYVKSLNIEEILVRCCGFHKILSIPEEFYPTKTIVTSVINYEEVFEEYIKNGWKIDFVAPITINKETGRLEEYPEEFLTIRQVLKSGK